MFTLKLVKPTQNFKGYKAFEFSDYQNSPKEALPVYDFEHMSEYNEDTKEIIFTASIKINYSNKYGRKLLKKMLDKQSSPIKIILQENDNDARAYAREGKDGNRYTLPDEIKKMITEDEKKEG